MGIYTDTDLEMLLELVRRVHFDPNDEAASQVLADWTEQKGVRGRPGNASLLLPFSRKYLETAGWGCVFTPIVRRSFQLRKIFICDTICYQLQVLSVFYVRDDIWHVIAGDSSSDVYSMSETEFRSEIEGRASTLPSTNAFLVDSASLHAIAGSTFHPEVAPTFDFRIPANARVGLALLNTSMADLLFSGAVSGA